jgi:hypothetical protein
VATAVFKQALTGPQSIWRVCSRQRLNQILGQGHGRYWNLEQNGARLRYRGAAALAELLSIERLTGAPVYVPFRIVAGKMAGFKASLYAAWHAGRGKEGDRRPRPISRATLAGKAGVSARTLQRYDRQAGVKRERHMAVGGRQRKINKQLNQPRDSVARGNGAGRIFHAYGAAAGAAYNRYPQQEVYWPVKKVKGNGRIWGVMPAAKG